MASKTRTRPGCAQVTNARSGIPAKTMSEGLFETLSVAMTRIVDRLTMPTVSEI